jgi:hypothetical protein
MAGQRWLAAKGIASQITIGVRQDEDGAFHSHAWLKYGEQIITGGDISGFAPILAPDQGAP